MKIIYVYDALCGWCYGFSPVMQQFYEKYQAELDFEVVSGGMVTKDRIGPIGEVAGYISWAYKKVEDATGVRFGTSFLQGVLRDGKAIFTSIPPSIALSVFKTHFPEQSVAFAARLQRAIYYDGIEPANFSEYGKLAAEFGLDASHFVTEMQTEKSAALTQSEFALSEQLGVTGFPTVFTLYDNKVIPVARGYVPFEQLERQFFQAKSMLSQ